MDIEKRFKNKSKYFLDNKVQSLNSVLNFLLNEFLLYNFSIVNRIMETIDTIETVKRTKKNEIIAKHWYANLGNITWRIYISEECVYLDPLIFNEELFRLNKLSIDEQFEEIENTYKLNKTPVKLEHEIFIVIICKLYKELIFDLSNNYDYSVSLGPYTKDEAKLINNIIENPENAFVWSKVYKFQKQLS